MPQNNISILVTAKDAASPALKRVSQTLDETSAATNRQSGFVSNLNKNWYGFAAVSASSVAALRGLFGVMGRGNKAANDLQSALLGLTSIASHFGQDADKAKAAARSLASDGLMTVADAATGLKNLLASGFSLPQAIMLMNRFKDSAAFNRQASLSFGEAIRSATEGIKNGNSILVDNAGVTKNLSVMLTEAGFSANDLMNATSNANVRQAIFNGIIRETNAQVGDAAKLTHTAAGKQAELSAQTTILYQKIGVALQPAIMSVIAAITPLINRFASFTAQHPRLTAAIILTTTAVVGLTAALSGIGLMVGTIGPAVQLFGPMALRSFGMARAGALALRATVSAPMVMGAIAVAGALADIALVMKAIQAVRGAISDLNAAKKSAQNYDAAKSSTHATLLNLAAHGTADQKARANALLKKGYASGTNYATGGGTLVGEYGPELVNLPRGAQVTPAWRTRGMQASGGDTHITISGNITIQTPQAAEAFWNRIDKTQRLAQVGMA